MRIFLPLVILYCGVAHANYSERKDVRAFIDEMVSEHQFDRDYLLNKFSRAERLDNVLESIAKPAERTLTWEQYRPIFLKKRRIELGRKFLREHRATLERAEQTYGVPKEIITAIIGVETFYGRHSGKYEVFDSLTTLAFDYPPRSKFFRSELRELMLLTREEDVEIESVRGSYAGAMGMPQFISSSYRNYAVDFDGDGKRDLWNSVDDVIGSVANYFKRHGWRAGDPVVERVELTRKIPDIGRTKLKPVTTIDEYRKLGVKIGDHLKGDEKAALIELEGDDGLEHWLGLKNFYVISRYNHSSLYSLAVYQLSQQF